MHVYLARRLLLTIPVLFIVALMTFVMLRLVPGDVTMTRIAEGGIYNPEQLDALREELGLNDPLPVQYARFVSNALRGDLGTSIRSDRPVVRARPVNWVQMTPVTDGPPARG